MDGTCSDGEHRKLATSQQWKRTGMTIMHSHMHLYMINIMPRWHTLRQAETRWSSMETVSQIMHHDTLRYKNMRAALWERQQCCLTTWFKILKLHKISLDFLHSDLYGIYTSNAFMITMFVWHAHIIFVIRSILQWHSILTRKIPELDYTLMFGCSRCL